MTIYSYGRDGRTRACRDVLAEVFASSRGGEERRWLYLLPIPSVKDGKIGGRDGYLYADLAKKLHTGDILAGYDLPKTPTFPGVKVVDVATDETFLGENAAMTAEGALAYLMRKPGRVLAERKIGIIGYGRIGRRLAERLLFHGAEVTVFTTRADIRETLGALGIATRAPEGDFYRGLASLGLDTLVNTAPASLVGREEGEALVARGCELIELASGDRFPHGLPVKKLPSLPARLYPKSAGQCYAAAILRGIKCDTGEGVSQ